MRTKNKPQHSERSSPSDSLEQHAHELKEGRSRGTKRGREKEGVDEQGWVGMKMRVWWCPTDDEEKTDFSGAWWPVRVMSKGSGSKYVVKYDNGETESVLAEHLSPYEVPMDFGKEAIPLQVTEFCEVFNGSSTDPCAWAACVSKTLKDGHYTVRYPFHDTEPEKVPADRIRRLRVLENDTWKLLRPNQHWRGGEVTSPAELETIDEEELGVYVDLSRVATQELGNDSSKKGDKSEGAAASKNGQNK